MTAAGGATITPATRTNTLVLGAERPTDLAWYAGRSCPMVFGLPYLRVNAVQAHPVFDCMVEADLGAPIYGASGAFSATLVFHATSGPWLGPDWAPLMEFDIDDLQGAMRGGQKIFDLCPRAFVESVSSTDNSGATPITVVLRSTRGVRFQGQLVKLSRDIIDNWYLILEAPAGAGVDHP